MQRKQLSNFIIEAWAKKHNFEGGVFFILWGVFTVSSLIPIFLNQPPLMAFILFMTGGLMYISGGYIISMDFWKYRKLSWADKNNPEKRVEIIYE